MSEEGTPKWMKRLVRARMKETGEKYTTALRAVKAEQAEHDRIHMPDGGLIHIGQDLNGSDVYLAIDKYPEGETHVGNADGDDRA